MNYLNKFKIALLENDLKTLENLIFSMPQFHKLEEIHSANALMQEAKVLFKNEQEKTSKALNELKTTKKLLNQNSEDRSSKLNLVF